MRAGGLEVAPLQFILNNLFCNNLTQTPQTSFFQTSGCELSSFSAKDTDDGKSTDDAQGFNDLETELKRLKSTERPDVIKAIAAAREHGDLRKRGVSRRARATGIYRGPRRYRRSEPRRGDRRLSDQGKIIKFGATVKVEDEDTDEKSAYQIVGEHEADIKSGKLSVTSPMARAMIGKPWAIRRGHDTRRH